MSSNYLPWSLYVLLAMGSVFLVLLYVKMVCKSSTKSFVVGLSMASIGAIMASIIKFASHIQILNQYQNILKITTITCTSIGIVLIMIGTYNKVKDNPEKRRIILILIGVLIITVVFMGLIVLSKLK